MIESIFALVCLHLLHLDHDDSTSSLFCFYFASHSYASFLAATLSLYHLWMLLLAHSLPCILFACGRLVRGRVVVGRILTNLGISCLLLAL